MCSPHLSFPLSTKSGDVGELDADIDFGRFDSTSSDHGRQPNRRASRIDRSACLHDLIKQRSAVPGAASNYGDADTSTPSPERVSWNLPPRLPAPAHGDGLRTEPGVSPGGRDAWPCRCSGVVPTRGSPDGGRSWIPRRGQRWGRIVTLAQCRRAPYGDVSRSTLARRRVEMAVPDAPDDDPRLAFIYQEALRGLLQQQTAVESLHNRAATLV